MSTVPLTPDLFLDILGTEKLSLQKIRLYDDNDDSNNNFEIKICETEK